MGNSKGFTPSLSLCNLVNALVSRNKEVKHSSEASGLYGFSAEMEIFVSKSELRETRECNMKEESYLKV